MPSPSPPNPPPTQIVLLLDGDFVVGPTGAHELLQEQYGDLTHILRRQGLVVLPAFKASDEWSAEQSTELLTWLLSGRLLCLVVVVVVVLLCFCFVVVCDGGGCLSCLTSHLCKSQ